MTIEAAFYNFYSKFGVDAYEENTIPDDAQLPYITYEVVTDDISGNSASISCTIWDRSENWSTVNEIARKVERAVNNGGSKLFCDNGAVWLYKGSPFAQNIGDNADDKIKGKHINLEAYFLINNF